MPFTFFAVSSNCLSRMTFFSYSWVCLSCPVIEPAISTILRVRACAAAPAPVILVDAMIAAPNRSRTRQVLNPKGSIGGSFDLGDCWGEYSTQECGFPMDVKEEGT